MEGAFSMKKLLTLLALIAFTGSVMAANAITNFTTKVNNGLATLDRQEQALNKKIDDAQAKRTAQKEAAAKKKAEQQAAAEKAKKEAQAKIDAQKKSVEDTKKAAENEVSFWKRLFGAN